MVFKYATIEFDDNEVLKKLDEAYSAMANAQRAIREAQDAVRDFKIKGNCGIAEDTARKN